MAESKPVGFEQDSADQSRAGLVMAVLFGIFFLGTSDNQMISPLLPLVSSEFGVDEGTAGELIGPAYALAAALAALVVGSLSDRAGRRRFLLYASLVFSASSLGVLVIADLWLLGAARLVTGLAAGTFSTCAIAYTADYFPYQRRGVAMSVVQAGYFAALVIGVPTASLIAGRHGWRSSFAFFGVLAAVAFTAILALLPDDRHSIAQRNTTRPARRLDNVRLVFERWDRVASVGAAFCVSCGFVGFIFYLGSWLTRSVGLSTQQVGLFFVIVGVASLLGSLMAGPISDRFGKRSLSLISSVLLAISLVLIPRLEWGGLLLVAFLAATLAFAFRQGPLQALATELVPRHARGALVAVRNTASQVGIASSTAASGFLYDSLGYGAVGLFSGVITLLGAACIIAMKEPARSVEGGD